MIADTVVTNCRLDGEPQLNCAFINEGVFVGFKRQVELEPSELRGRKEIDAQGRLMLPGLVETHVHLDKACTVSRCALQKGTLQEAIEQTSRLKAEFTYQDIYQRGKQILEKAIKHGTSYMRTHVEIDPVIGLVGFQAISALKKEYAWAITLELCVFPQEGLHNNPGTYELLADALDQGADLLGGCPYTDSEPEQQVRVLFSLAKQYDVDIDFHLDFDLDTSTMTLPFVIEMTQAFDYQGRVTVGHVTKLSALPSQALAPIAAQMAMAGVHLTALPSTDLFLNGRDFDCLIPRGVAPLKPMSQRGVCCSISSNNIENPFTPYGDASQIRMANLYANIAHLATKTELAQCFDWVCTDSARLMKIDQHGIGVGKAADAVFFDALDKADIVAKIALPTMGIKRGNVTFTRPEVQLHQLEKAQ